MVGFFRKVIGMSICLLSLVACTPNDKYIDDSVERFSTMDYKEERPLASVFSDLVTYHQGNHNGIYKSIGSPATDAEISAAEKIIGVHLPDELREVYKISNGQEFDAEPFFYDSYQFMSLDRAAEFWKILNSVYVNGKYVRNEGVPQGIVRDLWWDPKWIPFAENISGDALCIDLIPADGGSIGQIIEFIHDDTPRKHLGFRLVDFLGEYYNGLKSGEYRMHPEWKVIVKKEGQIN